MKKILLLLLTTGFFAKPILAQDCTSRPEQPIVDVFPTFCGSPTAEVYVEGPNGDDIQFVISTVGSSETITASNGDFRLNVGHSYIIFSQFISTGCTSATGTEITIDASTLPLRHHLLRLCHRPVAAILEQRQLQTPLVQIMNIATMMGPPTRQVQSLL